MPIWAIWDYDLGLEVLQHEKWERRRDLSDVIFRVASEQDPPYTSTSKVQKGNLPKGYLWIDDSIDELIEIGMFYGEIWLSLQYMTNFSYWMVRIADWCSKKFETLLFCSFRFHLLMEDGVPKTLMEHGMEW